MYETKELLLQDLRERTGGSILHELDDDELQVFIDHVDKELSDHTKITEKDRWTIWRAVK